MPRRGGVPKRDVLPDPIYNSKVITKLINQVMYDGKKGIAQRIVYDAFDIIKEKTGREAMEVFNQAMENIMPMVETCLLYTSPSPRDGLLSRMPSSA